MKQSLVGKVIEIMAFIVFLGFIETSLSAEVTKSDAEKYAKTTEQALALANGSLGLCYLYGNGVTKDEKKAVELFTEAAEQGLAIAQACLGNCYEFGKGITKDEKKAVEWYAKAAAQGNAIAQSNLGKCYQLGIGVTKDEKVQLIDRLSEELNNKYRSGKQSDHWNWYQFLELPA